MMNYKTGGKKVVMPEQAKIVDPRSEKNIRGENKKTLLGINPWRFQY